MEEMSFEDKIKFFMPGKKNSKSNERSNAKPIVKGRVSLKELMRNYTIKENLNKEEKKKEEIEKEKEKSKNEIPIPKITTSEELFKNIEPPKEIKEEVNENENKNKETQSYENIINNNPDELFHLVNQELVDKWKIILLNNQTKNNQLNDDSVILNTDCNFENQKVIKNDVIRSRGRESELIPSFHEYLEFLITYYCHQNNIKYKQGLNEIIAPMILLKHKVNLTLSEVYNLIQAFIDKFLTNYYKETQLYSLHSAFSLVTILLKYHLPLIYNLFEYVMVSPEMYATKWIMTAFSSKFRLDVVYRLWNILITINDSLFIFYLIVACLSYNSDIITSADITQIPSTITSISINSIEEVDEIFKIAMDMRNKTPYSFRILCNNLQIFAPNSDVLKECFEKFKPNNNDTLPIFPSEIFYITYQNEVKCPDEQCDNSNANNLFGVWECPEYHKCELCEMEVEKKIKYILLDMRIYEKRDFESSKEKTGFLPMMITLEQEELLSDDFADTITERFLKDKGKYHFVFLTSKTDYFTIYEDNFYKEKHLKILSMLKNTEKELDMTKVSTLDDRRKIKLKEYNNLKKTLKLFQQANIPYVSYVDGGFAAIHDLSFKYNLSLLNHEPSCVLCNENKLKKMNLRKSNQREFRESKELKEDKEIEGVNLSYLPIPQENMLVPKSKNNNQQVTLGYNQYFFGNTLTIAKVTKMLQEFNFIVSVCYLKEYKSRLFQKNVNNQIMIITTNDDLKIYKFNNQDAQRVTGEGLPIDLEVELTKMDTIPIINIRKIGKFRKINTIAELDYIETSCHVKKKYNKELKLVLLVEFSNEKDTQKFILSISKNFPQLKENK